MEPKVPNTGFDTAFVRNMVESALRIGLIFILLLLTYDIIRPFLIPLAWGGIIAIAAFPLARRIEGWLGGRRGLAVFLLTLFLILVLVVPCYQLMEALLRTAKTLAEQLSSGQLQIPGANPKVAEWPLIGDKLFQAWTLAHHNLEAAVQQAAPHLTSIAGYVAKSMAAGLASVLMFVVSLIIAGAFMAYAEVSGDAAHRIFVRLGGEKPGGDWAAMCVATVRSVLQGVVGVAVIQTLLCAVGLFIMGIPGAPIWTAIILFLAIAQLPPLLVSAPIIIYAFSNFGTTPASIFAVWMVISSSSDAFLKPLLMGRGLDIPMPIILIGAIGGMITAGIIGLFAGAVVLAVWYKLFKIWMEQGSISPQEEQA
jgi:predicted PurR-regulated permease PerM